MSVRYVVDTNVPIVANGGARSRTDERIASPECRIKAIEFLELVVTRGRIILDLGGEIQAEYMRHLNARGQPGVGDRFLQIILNSAPKRVERVELGKTDGEFDDFPSDPKLAAFDRSDRKFVAAGRKAKASIANATDSDWLDYRDTLLANNIRVRFICGCDKKKWF
ncbi:MAG: hypothetical protein ACT4O2_07695 [Beijerinckiaceae bacterium]